MTEYLTTADALTDVFLRINGYSIAAGSDAIYERMIAFFEAGTFDMAHLVPWLERIVVKRDEL